MKIPNKRAQRSFGSALEIVAAVFVLLGPCLINSACRGWGLYAVFAVAALLFAARLLENGGLHISFDICLGVLLGAFALLAFIWAENTFLHIRYIFTILTVTIAMLLAADYYALEKEKGLGSRLLYMLIFSADLCALWNLACWGFVDKFSLAEPFSAGMGQSDLLGIYMAVGLWCAAKAAFEGSLRRPPAFALSLPLVFVLIMSRSALSWFFGAAFSALFLLKKKKKLPAAIFGVIALVSGAFLAVKSASVGSGAAFADALLAGLRFPEGLGGGGFYSRQTQLQSSFYAPVSELGTGASLVSSFGLLGLLAALAFILWQLSLTLKHKSWFSAFTVLLGIYAFFAPLGSGLAGLMLLMCTAVYGEWRLGKTAQIRLSVLPSAVICCVLAAFIIAGGVFGVGESFKSSGQKYMLTDEKRAAESFSTAASINPFDAESCYGAANALRYLYENDGGRENAVEAEYHIKRAIERDEFSALYHSEYARLLFDMEDYGRAAEEGDKAIELAPLNDDYKVMQSESLYQLMQSCERGSIEAQRCYSRILECADKALDMDKKKTINDWADKAQPYTRIEYFAEGGENLEDDE